MGTVKNRDTYLGNTSFFPIIPTGVLPHRNLGKNNLGGVIFGRKDNTMKECLSRQLFGLPSSHIAYVNHIEPGLPLFLFNYSDRKLYGIFEAASRGQLNIDPYCWSTDVLEKTPYPAQDAMPTAAEDQFKRIIADNYHTCNHFWFELDHAQTNPSLSIKVDDQLFEGCASMKLDGGDERDSIIAQLKELALSQEYNDLHPNHCSEGSSSTEDIKSEENSFVEAPVDLEEKKLQDIHSSSDYHLIIPQLIRELGELKDFKMEQTQKMIDLEQKLVWAENEICYLRDLLKSLALINFVRAYASVAKFKEELFVFGGGDGESWHDAVESYSLAENKWTVQPSLNAKKEVWLEQCGNGHYCFSDVEMLDFDIGKWICARSMLQKRFALAAVELNGAIDATGGYDGNNYLNLAERFDPKEHSWAKIGSLTTKRGCHSLVSLNEKLNSMVASVEVYDPRLDCWMASKLMNCARGYSAAGVLSESIYVIGGVKADEGIVDIVECFKEGQSWCKMSVRGIGQSCFLSAIVR
ncbi:hypothetical protein NL676_000466 [Syzygium grande]|nr:hypothetical protein NL676_000466 [Syzygium grande]